MRSVRLPWVVYDLLQPLQSMCKAGIRDDVLAVMTGGRDAGPKIAHL